MYVCTAPSVAPSDFQTVNITSTSITFSWDPLVDQANGIIQFYVITCIADNINVIMVSLMITRIYYLTNMYALEPCYRSMLLVQIQWKLSVILYHSPVTIVHYMLSLCLMDH